MAGVAALLRYVGDHTLHSKGPLEGQYGSQWDALLHTHVARAIEPLNSNG